MNESISEQWINTQSKYTFLKNLKLNKRLYALFACACVRQIWNNLTNENKNKITIAELYVDGKATKEELITARNAVCAYSAANADVAAYAAAYTAAWDAASAVAAVVAAVDAAYYAVYSAYYAVYSAYWVAVAINVDNRKEMIITQGKLLESIVQPNLQYNPNWCSSTVKLLTQQIYEQQDWNLLPILADALQDNNCTNDELLFELRNGNLWCKGNRLLDEILEKR